MGIEYLDKNKCRLVVYCGSDAHGDPVRFIKTVTYTTKADAKKQYKQYESEVEELNADGRNMKLSVLMDKVLRGMKAKELRTTTLKGYEVCRKRILETLGDKRVCDITPYDIDTWIESLSESLSPKTVRNTASFLSTCLSKAVRWRIISYNSCNGAEYPKAKKPEKKTLKLEELPAFYAALKKCGDHDFTVAVELALFNGLRRSEILGLTNSSIDLQKGTVSVNQSRHYIDRKSFIQEPKTKSSNRILALPEFLIQDIRKLQKEHKENDILSMSDALILDPFGEPYNPNVLYNRLRDFEKANDLPLVSLHGLRHTYASMVNFFGRDLVEISNQLGHASKTITLDTYTHLFEDVSHVSREIASEINDFVIAK